MNSKDLMALGIDLGEEEKIELFQGKGCARCRGTGYRGRIGIFEVLPFTGSLKNFTTAEADQESLCVQAKKAGMISLRQNAVKKLLEGKTTYQEVLRVTWEQV